MILNVKHQSIAFSIFFSLIVFVFRECTVAAPQEIFVVFDLDYRNSVLKAIAYNT